MGDGGKGSKQRPTDMKAFSSNYDAIFKKDTVMQVRVKENAAEFGNCGCGRSPTGKCIGWHGLSEEAFQARLSEFKEQADNAAK
jgi:hypothetical protein